MQSQVRLQRSTDAGGGFSALRFLSDSFKPNERTYAADRKGARRPAGA